jgi:hypothetical protein
MYLTVKVNLSGLVMGDLVALMLTVSTFVTLKEVRIFVSSKATRWAELVLDGPDQFSDENWSGENW